jgi:hypothetical protein
MEPPEGTEVPELRQIPVGALRRAVELYLASAYADGSVPSMVQRRLAWLDQADDTTVDLTRPPFEPSGGPRPTVISLRLGNQRYPHMKLQLQGWPSGPGYLLSVNTHDQIIAPTPGTEEADLFRLIQAENQRLKLTIEADWEREGLPTFLGYLKDYIGQQGPGTAG